MRERTRISGDTTPVVGLLKCMEIPTELAGRHGGIEAVYNTFLKLADSDLRVRTYDATKGELPASVDECDAYVITGSPSSAYDEDVWIEKLAGFIQRLDEANHPLVGICFGHQIIAKALGGRVGKSDKGWGIGVHEYVWNTAYTLESYPWFKSKHHSGSSAFVSAVASHQDVVLELPKAGVRLAGSEFCQNGMYAIGDHIWTVQTHPEFTADFGRDLYALRRSRFSPDEYKDAITTLKMPLKPKIVSEWIRAFVEHHKMKNCRRTHFDWKKAGVWTAVCIQGAAMAWISFRKLSTLLR